MQYMYMNRNGPTLLVLNAISCQYRVAQNVSGFDNLMVTAGLEIAVGAHRETYAPPLEDSGTNPRGVFRFFRDRFIKYQTRTIKKLKTRSSSLNGEKTRFISRDKRGAPNTLSRPRESVQISNKFRIYHTLEAGSYDTNGMEPVSIRP